MRLIKPSFEIIGQLPGEVGLLKHIETCGRVAWKSEDRTSDDSYLKFIEMLKSVKHGSVLEHGTVYMILDNPGEQGSEISNFIKKYKRSKYSKVVYSQLFMRWYITTNYRVIVENEWFDDLQYMCEPTGNHEKRTTVRFVCDRGVSHEFVRHRVFSFTQESTRYCNYSKDKFGDELTFIMPLWLKNCGQYEKLIYANSLNEAEKSYMNLVNGKAMINKATSTTDIQYIDVEFEKWKPQQARAVLPNSLKTELIMTGFESDWDHFFMLRDAAGAHPQASELATPLHVEFENRKQNENSII